MIRKPRPPVPPTPKRTAPRFDSARPGETFEATFLGHPEGSGGFLRPVGAQKGQGMDLLVDWREARGAIHGDRVQVEVSGETWDGRLKGQVVRILARGEHPIPAHLQKQEWGWRAIPLEPRLQQIVSVPPTDLAGDGDLVSVKLNADPGAQQLRGVVVAKLGRPTDLKIENRLTAALFNIRTEFPQAVMEELAPFPTVIPADWITAARTCAAPSPAPSTRPPPRTSTMPSAWSPSPRGRRTAGSWACTSPTSATTSPRPAPWTWRPACAAPRCTSRTSASRCCRSA